MNQLITTLITCYLIIMLGLGYYAQKVSQGSSEDYFVAKRSVGWLHLGLTFFATWSSTLAFLALAGFHYKRGVEWYFTQGTFWMLAPFGIWFLGRHIWIAGKRNGFITPGDFFAARYNSQTIRVIVGALAIFSLIPYTLVQLVGIGKVFEVTTSGIISYKSGVLLTATITMLYTVLGGVRAIIWTDVIQVFLFLGVLLMGVGVVVINSGGLLNGFEASHHLHPELFTIDPTNIGSSLTTIIIWTPGLILLPHLWQRNYMAKSEVELSKSVVVFSVLSLFLTIATMIIGILAIGLMSKLPDSDRLIPNLFMNYARPFVPFLVLGTFAAGMSTIDSQLLSASSVLLRDVAKPLRIWSGDIRKEKLLGRISVACLIGIITTLALLPLSQGAIFTLASKGTAYAFLMLVPLMVVIHKGSNSAIVGNGTLMVGILSLTLLETGLIVLDLPLGFGHPVTAFLSQLIILGIFSSPYLIRGNIFRKG